MSVALSIYHRLPSMPRSLVASVRGYYLNRWRFDQDTEKLVEKALERDYWTASQWSAFRDERLSYILNRAATQVPYYRQLWDERRRRGDKASWQYLENWPVLEKTTLRSRTREFLADECNPARMYHDHTSGTTGTSLDLWLTRHSVKQWYALFEARCRRWYGITRHDRWAMFGGQLVIAARQKRPPFWVWNAAMNQLYMSSYHLAPDMLHFYLQALIKYRITYIIGYPSAIYSLAQQAIRTKQKDIELRVVIANAEPLYEHQRSAISQAFNCPVRETYGMAEIAAAASECSNGRLHQWPDAGIMEEAAETREGQNSTDLVCTGLINGDMPLIRYRVGDRGKLSAEECGCGKTLPLVDRIDGRSDDVLYTADGRRVGRLDPIFKSGLPIIEAQIIQKSLTKLCVRFVPDANFDDGALKTLRRLICDRMGDIEVVFEQVQQIPRTSRGKFRAVVCEILPGERPSLDGVESVT